jgi:succinate-semialdehyde dehydrogenase/glutarate-semialdehyde dehydrogenase
MRSHTSLHRPRARRSERPSWSTADTRFGKERHGSHHRKDEELLVGGRWVAAESGRRFDVTNPATSETVGTVPDAGEEDVRAAIDAAADALEGWKSLAGDRTRAILRRSADVIRERKDEIAAVMTAEQGKPLPEAAGEVEYAASFLEWFGGEAERSTGRSSRR